MDLRSAFSSLLLVLVLLLPLSANAASKVRCFLFQKILLCFVSMIIVFCYCFLENFRIKISAVHCVYGGEETWWPIRGHRITPWRTHLRAWEVLASSSSSCNLYIFTMKQKWLLTYTHFFAMMLTFCSSYSYSFCNSKDEAFKSIVYSYKHGFSGFAAMLTESQAEALASKN